MTEDEKRYIARGYLYMVEDAIGHAALLASRASERFDGDELCLKFHQIMSDLHRLRDDSPTIRELKTMTLPRPFLE